MSYAMMFGPNGFEPIEGFTKSNPVIVGDLLAIWHTEGQRSPRYLIDGLEGGMTPVGAFEKEIGAVAFRDGVLLIATKDYVEDWEKNREGDR